MEKENVRPMRLNVIKNAIWQRRQTCDLVTLAQACEVSKQYLVGVLNGDRALTYELDKKITDYLNSLNKLEIAV